MFAIHGITFVCGEIDRFGLKRDVVDILRLFGITADHVFANLDPDEPFALLLVPGDFYAISIHDLTMPNRVGFVILDRCEGVASSCSLL